VTLLHDAPEISGYLDEPAQLPSGAPGKNGYLRMGFGLRDGRTELVDLHRNTPLLVQQALHFDEGMPDLACVFMVSTSGGILQGDRNAIDIEAGARTQVHLTSQAATKIQEMDANYASYAQRLDLHEDSYVEFLPEPVIPYRHSRFIADTEVSIASSATLLYSEILMPGRIHYGEGEVFAYDVYSSTLRATRPGGSSLFTEKFIIEPARVHPQRLGIMGDFRVLGNVVLLTPPDCASRVLQRTPAEMDPAHEWAAGASRLPNDAGLIYKVLGMESEPVRAKVRQFWTAVRDEVMHCQVPAQFRWR
jgi:urease accessory protein